MADYGGIGGGGSLRDALNAAYPLTNLGGIATGFPPGGMPPRVGVTAQPVPSGGPSVIPPIPPVPGPTVGVPSIPGAPPNPQDDSAQAQLLAAQMQQRQPGMMGQGPPNYAAQLGLVR